MHPSRFFLTASLAALFVFVPTAGFAATYTVTTTNDTADGVCDSGCSLREAVIAANTGGADTIIIPAGTYIFTRTAANEELASTGDLDFTDTDLTTVTGAGSGLGGGATIIDPDDNDRGIDVKTGALVSMTALTINDGSIASSGGLAGGLLNEGTLTLNNVYVTGNALITVGSSDGYGAGVGCLGGEINITNSVISDNRGTSASGNIYGGGLAIAPTCNATLSDVTITGNQAMYGGGVAAFTDANQLLFTDVTISSNIAEDAGGGIITPGDDDANPLVINRALFESNQALAGGGVFATGPLDITNASFYSNNAGDTGGAISVQGNSPLVQLAFVTITHNTAATAAAIYGGSLTPNTYIKNSIVASNYVDLENFDDCIGTLISGDYNYIAAASSCTITPQLHDLINHPAASVYFTATPIDDGGNVEVTALWATGETLDMIPAASCTDFDAVAVAVDASGRSRPQNTRCDLGAYEKPDTVTQAPTLISPTTSSSQKTLTLQYTLPETPTSGSVTVAFTGPATRTLTMGNSTSVDTTVDLASLSSTSGVTSVDGGASLPDGTYTVTLSYRDGLANPIQSAAATSVTIDTTTQAPTLISPTSSSSAKSLHLQYTLPETPTSGSVTVAFTGSASSTLTMGNSTSVDTTVNLTSLASTSGVTSVTGGAALPDGTYTVTVSYRDGLANPIQSVVATSVIIDTVTQAPILTSPTTSSGANTMQLQYTLPETPQDDSVHVLLDNGTTSTLLSMDNTTSVDVTLNLSALTETSHVSLSNRATLTDGVYSVTLSYQDSLGNATRNAIATNVTLDTTTQAPVVTGPTTGARLNSPALMYTLPESPQIGSVRVIFNDGSTTTTLTMDNTLSVESALQLSNLGATTHVSSSTATTLADGTYTVTVQYRDALGNAVVSTIATGVVIDTTAPTITLLGATTATLTVGDTYTDPGYTASDAIDGNLHDSVQVLNTVNTNVAGVYTIYYTLTDATGNVATQKTRTITVEPAAVVEEPVDNTPTEPAISIPTKPAAVAVTKKKKAKLIIWDAVSESSYYNVIIKTKASKTKLSKTNITALKYKLTAAWMKQHLKVGKTYFVQLKACNTAGCSEWSATSTFKLSLTKPKS